MAHNGNSEVMENILLDTVREKLTESGKLNKIKCELRAMVINMIRDDDKTPMNSPALQNIESPTQLLNQLILEYLKWIGFRYTIDMFVTESGCAHRKALTREHLESMFLKPSVAAFDKDIPLLLELLVKSLSK